MEQKPYSFEIKNIASQLRSLHSSLLLILKVKRDTKDGKVTSPIEWFHLLMGDPEYMWFKPLNELLSDIDALDDRGHVSSNDASLVRSLLEELFVKKSPDKNSFNSRYIELVKSDQPLILTLGFFKEMFLALPDLPVQGDPKEVRLSWHKRLRKGERP